VSGGVTNPLWPRVWAFALPVGVATQWLSCQSHPWFLAVDELGFSLLAPVVGLALFDARLVVGRVVRIALVPDACRP
jgi:hypothetical protein